MFGDQLLAHRLRMGMTQEELADRSGVSLRTIQNLEAGRNVHPRPATVRLLAKVLGLREAEQDHFRRAAAEAAGPAGVTAPDTAPDRVTGQGPQRDPANRRPRPAQLPSDVAGFTGRAEQCQLLTALIDRPRTDRRNPASVAVAVVTGTAGIGKTAFAVHWAHQVSHRFPDGQLYVNLRGFDPIGTVLQPAEVLPRFLTALGVPSHRIPSDLDAQTALYRTHLADRRVLVVLDNAKDAAQVRPLLPGSPSCLVLVTSRSQLTSLIAAEGAHPIALDLLDPAEARQLLAARLGPDRLTSDPATVDEVIHSCARLPLALAIAAARAATRPTFPLSALATELRDANDRLTALASDDPATDVRAVFSCSYRTLTAGAARLFRFLGQLPGPDISAAAAASLAGLPLAGIRPLLTELAQAHLVIEHQPGRYSLHDLLRAYASERAGANEAEHERRAGLRRLLDHYLHTAYAAAILLFPQRDLIELDQIAPGVTPESLTDDHRALAWFTEEHSVLLAAIDHAAICGFEAHSWRLAWTMVHYFDRKARWADWAATQRIALGAAARLLDPSAEALSRYLLAGAALRLGQNETAAAELERALDLYQAIGDLVGQANSHHRLFMVGERLGSYQKALRHAVQALKLYRAVDHQRGQAAALNNIGWARAHLGDYPQAKACCQRSLELDRRLGNRYGQALTLDSLGFAHRQLGEYEPAVTCYRTGLALVRALGDRHAEATMLTNLGETRRMAGDHEAADEAWESALAILAGIDHPDAEAVRARIAALGGQDSGHPAPPPATGRPGG